MRLLPLLPDAGQFAAGARLGVADAGDGARVQHLGPVRLADEDGGVAERHVAPLQPRVGEAAPPAALDLVGVGHVVAAALQVDDEALEALALVHGGEEALRLQRRAALRVVREEDVVGRGALVLPLAGPEPCRSSPHYESCIRNGIKSGKTGSVMSAPAYLQVHYKFWPGARDQPISVSLTFK